MKAKSFTVFGLAVVFLLAGTLSALAAEKIGFVNFREVITTSNAGKAQIEDFKKIMDKDQAALQEKENELKKLKEELDKQKSTLKPEALKQKEANFEMRLRDYQVAANDFNNDLRQREQEIFRKMMPDILKIVKSMGETGKYTMIIDPALLQIPYFSPGNDLTKKVVEEVNKTVKSK